jgi:hypothetical protein
VSERWLAVFYRSSATPVAERRPSDAAREVPVTPIESEWLGWDAWVLPEGVESGPARR